MSNFKFECQINGETYDGDRLNMIQHDRHLEVLRLFHQLGAPIKYNGNLLAWNDIGTLSSDQARHISLGIRKSYDPEALRELFKSYIQSSDQMWKGALCVSGAPQLASAKVTITGIPFPRLQAAMNLDKLHTTNPELNPDHYFARSDAPVGGNKRLHIMETFGMHGGPSDVHAYVDPNLDVPGVNRNEEYPVTMRGYTTLASDGTHINVFAYHQFKALENGLDALLGCVFPYGTPKEVVDGHGVHMAIGFWELAKLAGGEF